MTARVKAGADEVLSFQSRDKDAGERLVLFAVDDVEYTMPAVVAPGYAIALATVVHQVPDVIDQGCYLIRELSGPKALTALLESNLTTAQWSAVIAKIWPHVFGQLEGIEAGN